MPSPLSGNCRYNLLSHYIHSITKVSYLQIAKKPFFFNLLYFCGFIMEDLDRREGFKLLQKPFNLPFFPPSFSDYF